MGLRMLSRLGSVHPLKTLCMAFAVSCLAVVFSPVARAAEMGVVVLHGKGGMPRGLVRPLAEHLAQQGFAVANLEMPWSKKRQYNDLPETAVGEIDQAFEKMKADGVTKTFLAGHSLGGVFAAYYAAQRPLTGLILVAPGGNVASRFWQKKVAPSLVEADAAIAAGRGDETAEYMDFEGSKGEYPIRLTARFYRAWFSMDTPLNQERSYAQLPGSLPVLNIVPVNDYKGLRNKKDEWFAMLPSAPGTEMFEPDTDHKAAPRDAAAHIAGWIKSIAAN